MYTNLPIPGAYPPLRHHASRGSSAKLEKYPDMAIKSPRKHKNIMSRRCPTVPGCDSGTPAGQSKLLSHLEVDRAIVIPEPC